MDTRTFGWVYSSKLAYVISIFLILLNSFYFWAFVSFCCDESTSSADKSPFGIGNRIEFWTFPGISEFFYSSSIKFFD